MSQQPDYFTLAAPGSQELLIKKSRFIGQAAPVSSEEEALTFIRQVKDSHKTARHHCFAYIIGSNAGQMRYQDDGEPQGTAGIPILEAMKKNGLVNCVCVVTRYFGGVLLGAGGLTRAYAAAAAAAIRQAGIVLAEPSLCLEASIEYANWDLVNHALRSLPVCDIAPGFTDKVQLGLIVRQKDAEAVGRELTSLTDGRAGLQWSEPFYHLWAVELEEDLTEAD